MNPTAPCRLRVTVIVPCHNYGRFLAEAVDSIDHQSRAADEILICDDGSTDDSWEHILEVAGHRTDVTLLRHPKALGVVATMNEMVRRGTGDVIVGVSADDRLGPRYLELLVGAIEANDWDFAYSDYQCFGAEDRYVTVPEMDVDLMARANYISGSAPFRTTMFERVGGFSDTFARLGFEDYDFWVTAIERGAIGGRVEGTYLEWRRHPGGSRNTVGLGRRLKLRLYMLLRHPRFFLHRRTLDAGLDWWRGRR